MSSTVRIGFLGHDAGIIQAMLNAAQKNPNIKLIVEPGDPEADQVLKSLLNDMDQPVVVQHDPGDEHSQADGYSETFEDNYPESPGATAEFDPVQRSYELAGMLNGLAKVLAGLAMVVTSDPSLYATVEGAAEDLFSHFF